MADPGLSVEVIRAQILDTRARVVVVSFEAVTKYLEANARLAEEDRVKNILVIDRDPWHDLPAGCSSFRELYNDDGSMCPKTLPGKLVNEARINYSNFQFQLNSDYDPDEVGVIHWTSGTTVTKLEFNSSALHFVKKGKPKGVQHTQRYLHIMMRKSKLPPRYLPSKIIFNV